MSRKLRVFISSTMSDLANERDAVIQKLSAFNFEPVNAESWAARETRPWDRIEAEIRSSDLFVLILGDRYGFEPGEGPGAAEGLSATHLEYRAARDAEQMPILVFLKWLDADNTKEDKKRDEFRDEVKSWARGHLTVKFDLVVFKNSISLINYGSVSSLPSDILHTCAQFWTHFNLWLLPLLDG